MVLVSIPVRIGVGIGKAKVCGEVDYLGARGTREQRLDHPLRRRMRQRAEGKIQRGFIPVDALDRQKLRQRIGRELRKYLTHVLAGAALGGEQRNLDARMTD